MSAQVIVAGSYNRDHIWRVDRFPRTGETRIGKTFDTGSGGKGFNQAIACHRQGAATLFIGAIGNDELGKRAQRDAGDDGLPCRWKLCSDVPTAATAVWVNEAGDNEIIVNPGANAHLESDFIAAQRDAFADAHVLLVQMEIPLSTVRAALEIASRLDMMRILNPAPMHADTDAKLLSSCDVLTPNETEFAQLLSKICGNTIAADAMAATADAELHALCRLLAVPTVIVTLGSLGCFVSHAEINHHGDNRAYYRVPAERTNVIDTTGAGDCFCGALAASLVRFAEQSFAEAVRHANRAAALSTEKAGAASAMPLYDDVIDRFSRDRGKTP